jgi:hypothetical protein
VREQKQHKCRRLEALVTATMYHRGVNPITPSPELKLQLEQLQQLHSNGMLELQRRTESPDFVMLFPLWISRRKQSSHSLTWSLL